jgi:transketolase N-terminal domain/subunit
MEFPRNQDIATLCINTIRTLSIDAVQKAGSGHPGAPMALAPLAYVLWNRVMRFDPADPIWPNRDRFVLSNGHASMLLWSILHLTGVKAVNPEYEVLGQPSVSLDDIEHFRQIGSHAPGHPEYHLVSGVETTTGPLGQGIATSVGMAIAQKFLASRYNQPDFTVFDYNIYATCGDGCLMEGIGAEAASLAGHLELDNLCWIYDNNHITIEGNTRIAFTEDVAARFLGYQWNVLRVGDANDLERIEHALHVFKLTRRRPTLIILDTHIGYGSPHRQDTAAAHGEPLGPEEVKLTKRAYGWPEDAQFLVPDGVVEHFAQGVGVRGAADHAGWNELMARYRAAHPALAAEIDAMQKRELPAGWDRNLPTFTPDAKGIAGRDASNKVLNVLAQSIPWFLGGSADLGALEQDDAHVRGRGRLRARLVWWPQHALRHSRARDGRGGQRHVAVEAAAVRGDLLHFQRLRARVHPPVGAHGNPDADGVHARRDGRRRGRADAPADRAARLVARHARHDGVAPRRCERGDRSVSRCAYAEASSLADRSVAPASAHARPLASCAGQRCGEGRVRARGSAAGRTRGHPDRDGKRSVARGCRA